MTQILNEAGLSRLLHHFDTRDIAIISVNKSSVSKDDIDGNVLKFSDIKVDLSKPEPVPNVSVGYGVTPEQLQQWNKLKQSILKKSLPNDGLSFIPVDGGYVESEFGNEVFEDSFFIIGDHTRDFDHFLKMISGYGKSFNQESVFVKQHDEPPFLLGTNPSFFGGGVGGRIELVKEPSLLNKNVDDKLNGPHTDKSHGEYFTSLKNKAGKRFSFKGRPDDPAYLESKHFNKLLGRLEEGQLYTRGLVINQDLAAVVHGLGGALNVAPSLAYLQGYSWVVRNKVYPYGKALSEVASINRLANIL